MSIWLSGIGVSRGIAIGRVQRMHGGELEVPDYSVSEAEVPAEVERFNAAQRLAREQLRLVRKQIPHEGVTRSTELRLMLNQVVPRRLTVKNSFRECVCSLQRAVRQSHLCQTWMGVAHSRKFGLNQS